MTGHPSPRHITWSLAWLGEQEQVLHTNYSGQQPGLLSVNMSDSTSSELTITCSACNVLGCATSNPLTLHVVGNSNTSILFLLDTIRRSFSL